MSHQLYNFLAVLLIQCCERHALPSQFLPVFGIEVLYLLCCWSLLLCIRVLFLYLLAQLFDRFLRCSPEESIGPFFTLETVDATVCVLAWAALIGFYG